MPTKPIIDVSSPTQSLRKLDNQGVLAKQGMPNSISPHHQEFGWDKSSVKDRYHNNLESDLLGRSTDIGGFANLFTPGLLETVYPLDSGSLREKTPKIAMEWGVDRRGVTHDTRRECKPDNIAGSHTSSVAKLDNNKVENMVENSVRYAILILNKMEKEFSTVYCEEDIKDFMNSIMMEIEQLFGTELEKMSNSNLDTSIGLLKEEISNSDPYMRMESLLASEPLNSNADTGMSSLETEKKNRGIALCDWNRLNSALQVCVSKIITQEKDFSDDLNKILTQIQKNSAKYFLKLIREVLIDQRLLIRMQEEQFRTVKTQITQMIEESRQNLPTTKSLEHNTCASSLFLEVDSARILLDKIIKKIPELGDKIGAIKVESQNMQEILSLVESIVAEHEQEMHRQFYHVRQEWSRQYQNRLKIISSWMLCNSDVLEISQGEWISYVCEYIADARPVELDIIDKMYSKLCMDQDLEARLELLLSFLDFLIIGLQDLVRVNERIGIQKKSMISQLRLINCDLPKMDEEESMNLFLVLKGLCTRYTQIKTNSSSLSSETVSSMVRAMHNKIFKPGEFLVEDWLSMLGGEYKALFESIQVFMGYFTKHKSSIRIMNEGLVFFFNKIEELSKKSNPQMTKFLYSNTECVFDLRKGIVLFHTYFAYNDPYHIKWLLVALLYEVEDILQKRGLLERSWSVEIGSQNFECYDFLMTSQFDCIIDKLPAGFFEKVFVEVWLEQSPMLKKCILNYFLLHIPKISKKMMQKFSLWRIDSVLFLENLDIEKYFVDICCDNLLHCTNDLTNQVKESVAKTSIEIRAALAIKQEHCKRLSVTTDQLEKFKCQKAILNNWYFILTCIEKMPTIKSSFEIIINHMKIFYNYDQKQFLNLLLQLGPVDIPLSGDHAGLACNLDVDVHFLESFFQKYPIYEPFSLDIQRKLVNNFLNKLFNFWIYRDIDFVEKTVAWIKERFNIRELRKHLHQTYNGLDKFLVAWYFEEPDILDMFCLKKLKTKSILKSMKPLLQVLLMKMNEVELYLNEQNRAVAQVPGTDIQKEGIWKEALQLYKNLCEPFRFVSPKDAGRLSMPTVLPGAQRVHQFISFSEQHQNILGDKVLIPIKLLDSILFSCITESLLDNLWRVFNDYYKLDKCPIDPSIVLLYYCIGYYVISKKIIILKNPMYREFEQYPDVFWEIASEENKLIYMEDIDVSKSLLDWRNFKGIKRISEDLDREAIILKFLYRRVQNEKESTENDLEKIKNTILWCEKKIQDLKTKTLIEVQEGVMVVCKKMLLLYYSVTAGKSDVERQSYPQLSHFNKTLKYIVDIYNVGWDFLLFDMLESKNRASIEWRKKIKYVQSNFPWNWNNLSMHLRCCLKEHPDLFEYDSIIKKPSPSFPRYDIIELMGVYFYVHMLSLDKEHRGVMFFLEILTERIHAFPEKEKLLFFYGVITAMLANNRSRSWWFRPSYRSAMHWVKRNMVDCYPQYQYQHIVIDSMDKLLFSCYFLSEEKFEENIKKYVFSEKHEELLRSERKAFLSMTDVVQYVSESYIIEETSRSLSVNITEKFCALSGNDAKQLRSWRNGILSEKDLREINKKLIMFWNISYECDSTHLYRSMLEFNLYSKNYADRVLNDKLRNLQERNAVESSYVEEFKRVRDQFLDLYQKAWGDMLNEPYLFRFSMGIFTEKLIKLFIGKEKDLLLLLWNSTINKNAHDIFCFIDFLRNKKNYLPSMLLTPLWIIEDLFDGGDNVWKASKILEDFYYEIPISSVEASYDLPGWMCFLCALYVLYNNKAKIEISIFSQNKKTRRSVNTIVRDRKKEKSEARPGRKQFLSAAKQGQDSGSKIGREVMLTSRTAGLGMTTLTAGTLDEPLPSTISELNFCVVKAILNAKSCAHEKIQLCQNTNDDLDRKKLLLEAIARCNRVEHCTEKEWSYWRFSSASNKFEPVEAMRHLVSFLKEHKEVLGAEWNTPFDYMDKFFDQKNLNTVLWHWNELRDPDWTFCYSAYILSSKINNILLLMNLQTMCGFLRKDGVKVFRVDETMKACMLENEDWSYDYVVKALGRVREKGHKVSDVDYKKSAQMLKVLLKHGMQQVLSEPSMQESFIKWRNILLQKIQKSKKSFWTKLFFILWPFFQACLQKKWKFAIRLLSTKLENHEETKTVIGPNDV